MRTVADHYREAERRSRERPFPEEHEGEDEPLGETGMAEYGRKRRKDRREAVEKVIQHFRSAEFIRPRRCTVRAHANEFAGRTSGLVRPSSFGRGVVRCVRVRMNSQEEHRVS